MSKQEELEQALKDLPVKTILYQGTSLATKLCAEDISKIMAILAERCYLKPKVKALRQWFPNMAEAIKAGWGPIEEIKL